ncbi:MAG: carboxypeptidase regulatory-like domain-containing protein [Bacillota bacterium]|nr:carboxypeptidase regulatory-like domain-containing protein [Bacillota bacterium]
MSSPRDGSEVGTDLVVTGTTSSPEDLVSVFIGDVVLAQARPAADGTFSVRVRVPPGQSELTVLSEDLAGNRASWTVTVINNSAVVILAPSYAATQSPIVEFRGRGPVLAMVSLAVNGRPAGSTKASATGDWMVRGVALSPGDNIVTASATNQRGEVVATEKPVVVHFRPTSGTALITGRVSDARTGGAVAGAEVCLVAGGATIATARTSTDGRYELKGIASGTWRLRAVALNYVTQETGDITLGAGETRTVDFALVPNRALVVRKSVSTSTCTTGDIVGYAITVENLTDGIVRDVRVVDLLPPGVAVIDGTSEVQSVPCEPDMVAPREATWAIGGLGPRESATVRFRAAVGFDAAAGRVTNAAYATGSTDLGPVKTPPAEATMHVSKGLFSDDGTVFGRVFLDLDGNGALGPDDLVLTGAAIVTEDGTEVATDACGLYSLKGVRPGVHTIVLREDSLPVNFECRRKARLVDVGRRALVRLDFPVVVANGYLNANGNGYWNGYGSGNGNENPGGNGVLSGNGKVNENGVLNGNGKSNGIGNGIGNGNGNGNGIGIGNGKANGNGTRAAIAKTYGKEPLVLVALGEAVISSATFSGNVEEAQAVEGDGARTLDGNLAFFLRGWIKGKYLLTAGFDLGRHLDGRGAYLNPDAYYPVYGDRTQVIRSLPYAGPLYVGIEWDGWKATWSTFHTDFMESDLASYVRTLPGGLVRYERNHVKAAVFDSVTTRVAARDEFAADGTSGPFQLTHTRVIRETERVQVVTRNASGVEVATRVLRRDVDYDIDYVAGSILLAAPLPKEDGAGDLNFLVVSYEYEPVATDIASHVQGAAASAWVTPRLRLGGGIVKHAASPAPLLLYNVHGE